MWHPTGPAPHRACSATCFGPPNVKVRERFALRRRTVAKVVSAQGRSSITFRYQCRRCASSKSEGERSFLSVTYASHDAKRVARDELGFVGSRERLPRASQSPFWYPLSINHHRKNR